MAKILAYVKHIYDTYFRILMKTFAMFFKDFTLLDFIIHHQIVHVMFMES